ncbi:ABC-type antimicrobial peptide transport system permease subunit [Arcicella aurantiaca]|uniref:ABC-type antimicrobial peptide transport system permease subunit n=1 Tax=Arcicella aurantiaca TaxID=591202 RepID=A0A316E619_9BACT|nr:ABC transporter permease [Arcicella aurantiaca]PWK26147.1 ABC-type antimicrobial peptide transport system permease subunit [Arcicella aurantiaca]
MLQNYLKIALRNLLRNKVYSFINIAGLAVGMAVAMLIGLWIYDEVSANKHHKNYETLYQVKMHQTFDGHRGTQDALPFPIGVELKTKYPDFKGVAMCDWGSKSSLVLGTKKLLKEGHFLGEDGVDMFSLNILKGDKNPLHDPYSIVLTDETAKAFFGDENPIGKVLKFDNKTDVKVTAVVAKQPHNSTLKFDFLLPWQLQVSIYPWMKNQDTEWGNNSYQTFVQLRPEANEANVNAKVKELVRSHFKDDKLMFNTIKPEIFIHPMAKWRLYSEFENGVNTGGFIKYVRLFGILGLLVLVIACINFMNLSTARSEKRAKEVGIRKAVGSVREQLIGQFLSESLMISFFAFLFALVLVSLSLPFFNTLTEKEMSLQLNNPLFWTIMIAFTILTGLLAGSYPAFYLSAFNPVRVLKGNLHVGRGSSLPRKVLVVVQFACSVILMIGTIIIYQQVSHGKDRPVGFTTKGLISISWTEDIDKHHEAIRNELVSSGAATSITKSNSEPTQIWSNNRGWEWKGSQPNDKGVIFSTIATSYDYVKTMGIKMIAGRDFSEEFASDSLGVILNESAVKRMGLDKKGIANAIGETLKWGNSPNLKVIGVIPDMQMESPFRKINPLTIVFNKTWVNKLVVRLNPSMSASDAINKIKPIIEKYNPGFPFDYQFADEQYAKKFNYEELVGNLAAIVALLAIFISCLGLFGLASFMAEQRTKEIGVRKVLGASVLNLWQLLSKDFVMLVLIACGIAMPIAYYAMNEWLKDYEYKINIGLGVFVLVIVVAVLITLLTVSYQAIKAAIANPVKSLRTE